MERKGSKFPKFFIRIMWTTPYLSPIFQNFFQDSLAFFIVFVCLPYFLGPVRVSSLHHCFATIVFLKWEGKSFGLSNNNYTLSVDNNTESYLNCLYLCNSIISRISNDWLFSDSCDVRLVLSVIAQNRIALLWVKFPFCFFYSSR